MLFTTTPEERFIEKIMVQVPGFRPRQCGIFAPKTYQKMKITVKSNSRSRSEDMQCDLLICHITELMILYGSASRYGIMLTLSKLVKNEKFKQRINELIKERKYYTMNFSNETHRKTFESTLEKINGTDRAMLSAVYLLTADSKLWHQAEKHIDKNCIYFESLHTKSLSENAYTCLCCAKDLYLGSKHITISDLADASLIPSKLFITICNAMAIRRFGVGAVQMTKNE